MVRNPVCRFWTACPAQTAMTTIFKKPAVIALHCSGSTGRQWSKLSEAITGRFTVIAPDLIGCGGTPMWGGEHPFTMADEAAPILKLIDAQAGPLHLVGHSYGGGVALYIAHVRPERIASLSLYEPTAFHLLRRLDPDEGAAFAEIRTVADEIGRDLTAGAYRRAARRFVDYWGGAGSWAGMQPQRQERFVRYVPKITLDFRALIEDTVPLAVYRRLTCPTLLMHGAQAPKPTLSIARALETAFPNAEIVEVAGAGHMGPFSHADLVCDMVNAHLGAAAGYAEAELWRKCA
jgi:pimeloyl-ACP methyl ester carboxylesterase